MLFVLCFIFTTAQSIKLNGSCPVIATEDHFNCNDFIGFSESFFPMAHLPMVNNSLNMFLNPFNRLECLGLAIRCQKETPNSFHLELSCTPDDENAVEFCTMPLVGLQTNTKNSTIDFNYFTDDDQVCPRIMQNVKLVKFVANEFVILHGCSDCSDGEHEEGAWILGFRSNFSESMRHLSEALDLLKNSAAKVENFRVYNFSATENLTGTECGCNFDQPDPCEFFSRCKIEDEDDLYYYEYE